MLAEVLRLLAPTARTPTLTRNELRAAVVELQARGLRLRDISAALGIAEGECARLTSEPRHGLPATPGECPTTHEPAGRARAGDAP